MTMTDTTDPREGEIEDIPACECHKFWPTHHPECPAMQAIRALEAAEWARRVAEQEQPESASEHAELLADLEFYTENDYRNPLQTRPATQAVIRIAIAAIRALEAKVQWLEGDVRVLRRRDDKLVTEIYELRADRDRLAGEVERLEGGVEFWRGSHAKVSAEVSRLTAELEKARRDVESYRHAAIVAEQGASILEDTNAWLAGKVERLEMDARRWRWMFPDSPLVSVTERMQRVYRKWDGSDSWNDVVDAARRAGEGEK